MKKLVIVGIAFLATMFFLGCGTPVVYNINNNAIVMSEDKKASMAEIEKAIIKAGVGLGWSIKRVKDGELEGNLALRSHLAVVSIKYNTDEYSINYKNSTNLDYSSTTNTIHSNYNGWIQNLNKAIQIQLSLL